MDDKRNEWQSAQSLADVVGCHPATIRKSAVELGELPGEEVYERRAPTQSERARFAAGLHHVYRLRPVFAQVEQLHDRRALEESDLRDVEIDWRQFFVEHKGEEFVSLRAMVDEGGLYSRYDAAKRALERTDLRFHRTVETVPGGGPPREDCLLQPGDAQSFAASAGTDVGRQIARVIIEHHNAYQRMRFDGDVAELGRLVDRRRSTNDGTHTLDLIISLAGELKRDREKTQIVLDELRRRIAVLEGRGRRRPQLPSRPKAEIGADRIDIIRKHFDRALTGPALEVARDLNIDLGDAKHELNQWCKAMVRKPRDRWSIGDYVLAVELLEAHRGIDLHHIFQVDEAQVHLVLDDTTSFCAHCGNTYYSHDCPSCSQAAHA